MNIYTTAIRPERLVHGDVITLGAGPLVVVGVSRCTYDREIRVRVQKGETATNSVLLGGDTPEFEIRIDRSLEFGVILDEDAIDDAVAKIKTMIVTDDFQEIPEADYYQLARVLVNDAKANSSDRRSLAINLVYSLFERNLTVHVTKAQIDKLARDLKAEAA